MQKFYAHSVEGKPESEWQGLEEHLRNAEGTVPDLRTERSVVVESGLSPAKKSVAIFGDEFGSGDWAYLAGLRHEVGKYSTDGK